MAHWRSAMEEKEFLFAFNLDGKEYTLTIRSVASGVISGDKGKTTKKPICTFVETTKKLALNATNCKTIEAIYGTPDIAQWVGKRITLYPTKTTMGPETVDCIRIRPVVPPPKKSARNLGDEHGDGPPDEDGTDAA